MQKKEEEEPFVGPFSFFLLFQLIFEIMMRNGQHISGGRALEADWKSGYFKTHNRRECTGPGGEGTDGRAKGRRDIPTGVRWKKRITEQ